jgi:uncharacterized protein YegP (UPF0339 family)
MLKKKIFPKKYFVNHSNLFRFEKITQQYMPTINVGRAEISPSRSKKKPFKVRLFSSNGELIMTPQLLTTRRNCHKNLIAVMKLCSGTKVRVIDTATKYMTADNYILHEDWFIERK